MKSTLTPERAKEMKKWREERRQENKKRYKAFLKTETGKAYKKYDEVFGPPPPAPNPNTVYPKGVILSPYASFKASVVKNILTPCNLASPAISSLPADTSL